MTIGLCRPEIVSGRGWFVSWLLERKQIRMSGNYRMWKRYVCWRRLDTSFDVFFAHRSFLHRFSLSLARFLPASPVLTFSTLTFYSPSLPHQSTHKIIIILGRRATHVRAWFGFVIIMGHEQSTVAGVELSDETVNRLTKNTNYTPEQIHQWHQSFLRDCPNGKLSSRQFIEVYKKFYPEFEAEKYSSQVFRTFDLDHNGYIDFVEFLLAVNVNAHGDMRDKLGLAFDIYDINGNGQVRNMKATLLIVGSSSSVASPES